MIDPITPATVVPWRGKAYSCQATLGALAAASGALDIPILEPVPGNAFTKPEYFKRGVLLFALIRRAVPTVTLDECLEEVTGPKAEHYLKAINEAYEHIVPAITKLMGAAVEEKAAPPLAESSSGADSGPALVSTSGSRRKSSGR